MRIDRFLTPRRIVDIQSRDFRSALLELLALCPEAATAGTTAPALLEKLLHRERTIPTHLDNSVALPHVRVPLGDKARFIFAVGRCPDGLPDSPDSEDKKVRILFLVLAADDEDNYHSVLFTLARTLEDKDILARLENAPTLREFRARAAAIFKGVASSARAYASRLNQLMLREAERIALAAKCHSLLLFSDTFTSAPPAPRRTPRGLEMILVTQRGYDLRAGETGVPDVIVVRAFSRRRLSQLRSALLVGLMRGIVKATDRVCCVGGIPGSNKLDILLVVDMALEFPRVLSSRGSDLLPQGVRPEVLERALGIATELAVEGREGKPVGCILVIGNRDQIKPHAKPLILNPFYGYAEEDRNILNPFMDETVKELSSIDGAFIINGDGVIESAGSMLTAHEEDHRAPLPGGLGTRHAAAAAITRAADCVTIVVSSSTGQVTLFRKGEALILMDRSAPWSG